ncbi:MAG: hypothetical protein H7Z16_20600 [Pyrinomonadaceae bacterium]|nr:hypothetical protein [Pyrinomonadaceae bacterium]
MKLHITLSDVTAMAALIFGLSGLVLSIVNYLRDRAIIVVDLQWDMTVKEDGRQVGIITIANVGRRPVYISHAALRLPRECKTSHLVMMDAVQGERLGEGDRPKLYLVQQDIMEEYAEYWYYIRAQVSDSTGKVWYSKKHGITKKPSWAGGP